MEIVEDFKLLVMHYCACHLRCFNIKIQERCQIKLFWSFEILALRWWSRKLPFGVTHSQSCYDFIHLSPLLDYFKFQRIYIYIYTSHMLMHHKLKHYRYNNNNFWRSINHPIRFDILTTKRCHLRSCLVLWI